MTPRACPAVRGSRTQAATGSVSPKADCARGRRASQSSANWRIDSRRGTMNLVAAGPAPAERLQTIALGTVALAGVAAAEQAARFVRGFDSVSGPLYASLSVWE